MHGAKEIHTRIDSVGSTRKFTKAMEMVVASKMRRVRGCVWAQIPSPSFPQDAGIQSSTDGKLSSPPTSAVPPTKIPGFPMVSVRKPLSRQRTLTLGNDGGVAGLLLGEKQQQPRHSRTVENREPTGDHIFFDSGISLRLPRIPTKPVPTLERFPRTQVSVSRRLKEKARRQRTLTLENDEYETIA